MNYSYEINPKNKTIFVSLSGDIKTKEFYALDKDIRAKAKGLKYKVIFDLRDTKNLIPVCDSDGHLTSNSYQSFNDLMTIPVAFIMNEKNSAIQEFFKTISFSQIYPLKIFINESSAYQWLDKL